MKKMLLLFVSLFFLLFAADEQKDVRRVMIEGSVLDLYPQLINRQWGIALGDSVLVARYNDTVYTIPFAGTDSTYALKAFVDSTRIQLGNAFVQCNIDGSITASPDVDGTYGLNFLRVPTGTMFKPLTDDGTGVIFLGNGESPSSDENIRIEPGAVSMYVGTGEADQATIGMSRGSIVSSISNGASCNLNTSSASLSSPDAGTVMSINNIDGSIVSGTSSVSVTKDGIVSNTNTVADYDNDITNTVTINKEIFDNKTTLFRGQKRDIIKGWDDPYTPVYSFDDPTRTLSVTHPSGTCSFYAGGIEYDIPNGDPRLSTVIPDLHQWNYTYHDTLGQLTSATSVPLNVIRRENLGPIILWDFDIKLGIAQILRSEAKQANEVENEASYETKSIIGSDLVQFNGSLGSNKVGHSDGVYYSSRDKRFTFAAVDSSAKTWVKYYQDSLDAAGCQRVKASVSSDGIPYITDVDLGIGVTGRLVYNDWDEVNGWFNVVTGATNDYVAVHYIVGDGMTRNVLATIGQETYNSLADARAGLSAERQGLTFETTVFRDVGIVASCIFKTDGTLQYVDTDLSTLFDYPAGGVTAVAGGGTNVTLQTAYNNSAQPHIVADGSRGAFQVEDGVGGGAPIFEVLDSSGAFVMSVSDTGIDAGGQKVNNLNSGVLSTDAVNKGQLNIATDAGSVSWDDATLEAGWLVFNNSDPNYVVKTKIVGPNILLDGGIEKVGGVAQNEKIFTINTAFPSGYSPGDFLVIYKAGGGGYRVGVLIHTSSGNVLWGGDSITDDILLIMKTNTSFRDRIN